MVAQYGTLFPIAAAGQQVVLPAGSRVVRVVAGDSLAGVLNCTRATLAQQAMRGNKPDATLVYQPRARYWSRWLLQDGSGDWVITDRTGTDTSGGSVTYTPELYSWLPLHDHAGWRAPSDATDLGTCTDIPLAWFLDYWAQQYLGQYIDVDTGQQIGIDYIIAGNTGSNVSPTGTPSTSITNTWDPVVVDGVYAQLVEYGYVPAINALRAEAEADMAARRKNPARSSAATVFVESMLFTAGGYDSSNATYAANLGANMQKLLHSFERDMGGKIPTVLLRPFNTGNAGFSHYAAAQASFDAQFGAFGDGPLDWVQAEGLSFQEEASAFPGIHPDANGASLFARRVCDAINRMAARGQTIVPISADLS